MYWDIFFTSLGGSSLALVILGFLFKQLIETNINRALEAHKSDLRIREIEIQAKIDALNHDKKLLNSNAISKKIVAVEESLHRMYELLVVNFPNIPAEFKKRNIQKQETLQKQKELLIDGLHYLLTSILDAVDKSHDVRLILISHCVYLPDNIAKEMSSNIDHYTDLVREHIQKLDEVNNELEVATDLKHFDIRELRNEYTKDIAQCLNNGRTKIVQMVREEIGFGI